MLFIQRLINYTKIIKIMKKRTKKLIIGEKLVEFLNNQKEPFYKSKLTDKETGFGMSPKTAEEWLDLYEIFNAGPKIRKIILNKNIIYEVIGTTNE